MAFDRFYHKSGEIPTLYDTLDVTSLEQFMTDEEYEQIKGFENYYILPFFSKESRPKRSYFGFGLSRLMIRNLMLLPDVSIHGPEDTPEMPCESINFIKEQHPRSCHVTGMAHFNSEAYTLEFEVHRPGRSVKSGSVEDNDFKTFLRKCTTAIARLIGSTGDKFISKAWDTAQPRDLESLIQLGKLHFEYERKQMAERGRAAQEILDRDSGFVVPLWNIDEELPNSRQKYLKGLDRDPYNAQLLFMTFCAVWHSRGPQPEALQFCRRAIELSLGHGKAHMCAPHTAHNPQAMLRHNELGYRLLPGNSFAVNNYTLALTRANAPAEKRIELAREGIKADPRDPGSYYRLIDLCKSLGEYELALKTAERLQKLFEPTMDERALYCLRQNPNTAKMLESGAFNPAAANRREIAELRKKVD